VKVVILAGGMGTRLSEETSLKPKPMIEIGGRPMLWHIMKIYASFGFTEFIIAMGYRSEVIKNYFLNYYHLRNDLTIRLRDGSVEVHDGHQEDWTVQLVFTGTHTNTGGRLRRLTPWLKDETFMMTYGDGVANIRVDELLDFHRKSGRLATVTAVQPPARFGSLTFDGDRVTAFAEKAKIAEGWINGGFFVLEPAVLGYVESDDTLFERSPLERLTTEGELAAYKHRRFWQCLDTRRDMQYLEDLWNEGTSPWKTWTD
jgi:glucose-1-phosphate cytidylyltransferase